MNPGIFSQNLRVNSVNRIFTGNLRVNNTNLLELVYISPSLEILREKEMKKWGLQGVWGISRILIVYPQFGTAGKLRLFPRVCKVFQGSYCIPPVWYSGEAQTFSPGGWDISGILIVYPLFGTAGKLKLFTIVNEPGEKCIFLAFGILGTRGKNIFGK